MQHFTHLGRPIDLRHRSNRHALAVGAAALGAVLAVHLGRTGVSSAAARAAVIAGIGSFLAWAIGRELDPDRSRTALIGAIASIATTLWLGEPSLSLLAAGLLTARVLLRPSGRAPRLIDLAGLIALGAYLGTQPGGWGAGLVLAFAVARDRQLPGETAAWSRTTAALIAAFVTGVTIRTAELVWMSPSIGGWLVIAVGILASVATPPDKLLSTRADYSESTLEPRRLASARRVTVVGLLAAGVVAGQAAIVGTAPAWMAVCSVALLSRGVVPAAE